MNKFLAVSLLVVLSLVLAGIANANSTIGTNMSTTGTFTQTVGSATAASFQNAAGTITVLAVDTTNTRVGIGAAPATTFEVQGTASASYFFTTSTLQAGGTFAAASVAYSRFGIGTTGHSLAAADDVLFSGLVEFDDNAFFDGKVGIGGATDTKFEVQGTASASYFLTGNTIQVGGFASVAWSRFGTGTAGHTTDIDAINDLLISGALEVDGNAFFDGNASVAGSFELTGNTRFGINAGAVTNTTFEVGGSASISGSASVSQGFSAGTRATATSSFIFDSISTTQGACIKIKDQDGSGYTYLRVNGGSGTFSAIDCTLGI